MSVLVLGFRRNIRKSKGGGVIWGIVYSLYYPASDEHPCILIQPDVAGAERHPVRLDGLREDGQRFRGIGRLNFYDFAHVCVFTRRFLGRDIWKLVGIYVCNLPLSTFVSEYARQIVI